jgi:hypothetical protein
MLEKQRWAEKLKESAERVKSCDGMVLGPLSTISTDAQADGITMTNVAPNMALPNSDDSAAAGCELQ